MKLDASNGRARPTPTPAASPSTPRLPCVVFVHGALHDHSVWTLLARWFAHHGHARAGASTCPGHGRSGGAAAGERRGAGRLAARAARRRRRAARRAGRPQHGVAGRARGGGARAASASARLVMLGTAYPMKVSTALLDTARDDAAARDRHGQRLLALDASPPSRRIPARAPGCTAANRALMRRMQAAQRGTNLFLHDFPVCDRYANGLAAAARVACPVTLVARRARPDDRPRQAAELASRARARTVTLSGRPCADEEAPDARAECAARRARRALRSDGASALARDRSARRTADAAPASRRRGSASPRA